jgi:hypothetical protein
VHPVAAASVATTLIFLLVHAPAAAAQARQVEILVEGDSIGLFIGGSSGIVVVNGEAFEFVEPGYGLQLFVGNALSSAAEVHAGVAMNSHPDSLAQDRVNLLSAYLEAYFIRHVSPVVLGIGPRIAWMQETRAIFNRKLRGFGFGGNAGVRLPVGSRTWIESAVVFTSVLFPGADLVDGPPDPDKKAPAAIWELRLGVAFRLN